MEDSKKNKGNEYIIIFLIIVVIGLVGYIVYDNFVSKKDHVDSVDKKTSSQVKEKEEEKAKLNVSDYVAVKDIEVGSDANRSMVKEIELKNLPSLLVTEFNSQHTKFINSSKGANAVKLSNDVVYSINNNILSVYTEEKTSNELQPQYKSYSLNVDLINNKILTNQELLNKYNINTSAMFEKILTDLANTVTVDKFLLSVDGDITAGSITVNEFKGKVKTYAAAINNKYDAVTLYLKDNKLYASYDQAAILTFLGMSSHQGIGLAPQPQSTQLN